MANAKGNRVKITLACTECNATTMVIKTKRTPPIGWNLTNTARFAKNTLPTKRQNNKHGISEDDTNGKQ